MVRTAGRLSLEGLLAVFYAVGWAAGAVVLAVVTVGSVVALGWSDARKRGRHGAA